MGKLGHMQRNNFTPVNGSYFFLDFGNGDEDGLSQTKSLEQSGWQGVCVGPFPEAGRSCKPISMPVAAKDGDQVLVSDCSQTSPLQVLMSAVRTVDCPKVPRAAVGVAEVLKVAKAPRIIDFVALHTEGSELSILNRFPFSKYCVRSWTVKRNPQDASKVTELLQSRSCKVKDLGDAAWARCHCDSFQESLLQSHLVPRVGNETTQLNHRQRKKFKASIVPSGMLVEEAQKEYETDPMAESAHILGGASGMGGSLLRRSFA